LEDHLKKLVLRIFRKINLEPEKLEISTYSCKNFGNLEGLNRKGLNGIDLHPLSVFPRLTKFTQQAFRNGECCGNFLEIAETCSKMLEIMNNEDSTCFKTALQSFVFHEPQDTPKESSNSSRLCQTVFLTAIAILYDPRSQQTPSFRVPYTQEVQDTVTTPNRNCSFVARIDPK
jgi:hypothetical protein